MYLNIHSLQIFVTNPQIFMNISLIILLYNFQNFYFKSHPKFPVNFLKLSQVSKISSSIFIEFH